MRWPPIGRFSGAGIDGPDTDARHIDVLRRQLTGALELLAVPVGQTTRRATRAAT